MLNQPDMPGTCPLHAALCRLRRYGSHREYSTYDPLAVPIIISLAAGADPSARDGHSNTILRYAADGDLSQSFEATAQACLLLTT